MATRPAGGNPSDPGAEIEPDPPAETRAEAAAEAADENGPGDGDARRRRPSRPLSRPLSPLRPGLGSALGLTLASALLWGAAHLWVGRRVAGTVLMGLYTLVITGAIVTVTVLQGDLARMAVQTAWLNRLTAALLVLGAVWVAVVIWSYRVVRPGGMEVSARTAGAAAVAVLCLAVATPLVWAAHISYVSQDTLGDIFRSGGKGKINKKDPWNGQRRVNVLLLGGDAAPSRPGVRTDSMTLASVDTRTGDTVLLSLPRNLESFPMPEGPARDRFPYGFTGDGPDSPGLLNEVFEYAEYHPDVVPGVPKKERGPRLLMATIGGILGEPVNYYVLVDMAGFAEIIDAMGGVRLNVTEPIIYGRRNEGVVKPGNRTLSGKEALWYGRSRTYSDDYTRMGRQKCLLRAVAKQADPQKVLRRFNELASATKRAISTDIPAELLPALVDLSGKVRGGARITSLQFVPPLISTGDPDFEKIRELTDKAIATSGQRTAGPTGGPTAAAPTGGTAPTAANRSPAAPEGGSDRTPGPKPVSLDDTCPN